MPSEPLLHRRPDSLRAVGRVILVDSDIEAEADRDDCEYSNQEAATGECAVAINRLGRGLGQRCGNGCCRCDGRRATSESAVKAE